MSAEQNLSAFRAIVDQAFNQGHYDALERYVDPNFVEHQYGLHPTLAGMAGDIAYLRKAFPDFHLAIEDLTADGDKVWARMTGSGTNTGGFMGPPNGKHVEIAVFDLARFQDGKLVEHWGSPDRFHLLVQLGLLPQQQPA